MEEQSRLWLFLNRVILLRCEESSDAKGNLEDKKIQKSASFPFLAPSLRNLRDKLDGFNATKPDHTIV